MKYLINRVTKVYVGMVIIDDKTNHIEKDTSLLRLKRRMKSLYPVDCEVIIKYDEKGCVNRIDKNGNPLKSIEYLTKNWDYLKKHEVFKIQKNYVSLKREKLIKDLLSYKGN